MARLIDADALHAGMAESYMLLHKLYEDAQDEQTIKNTAGQLVAFAESMMRVKDAPTIDAEPVRHGLCDICDIKETGHGAIGFYGNGWQVCIRRHGTAYEMVVNHCGDQIAIPIDFCPECGAKMDGGAEDVPS